MNIIQINDEVMFTLIFTIFLTLINNMSNSTYLIYPFILVIIA